MNITLFGYQKTGKTTLFNLLTEANIPLKAYDNGKEEINRRTCPIPDDRLDKISSLYPEKEKKPVLVDFIDLAGISYGEVNSSTYLNLLRTSDGLIHIVRGFSDPRIPHLKKNINPKEDICSMEEELILTDLISVEFRLEKLDKELKRSKSPESEKENDLLKQLHDHLQQGTSIREVTLSPTEEKMIRNFSFLSQKPILHMVNIDENELQLLNNPEKIYTPQREGSQILTFCGKIESEIIELEDQEKNEFLNEFGLKELSAPKVLKATKQLLDLITFITIGAKEIKAWTTKKNTTAQNAAGKIHTDIEKGFIRAEVIPWNNLIEYDSFQAAKEDASVRIEGKDYLIQDGDVIYFRFAK